MHFSSDNWAGAHPRVAESLLRHASGYERAYGAGELDKAVAQKFAEVFEREVEVFFVATGTAANTLALTLYNRPGGIAFCHREAHVVEDECGAFEYLSGGSRLHTVDGAEGRIAADRLDRAIGRFVPHVVHSGRPIAVTITQATEAGTVYSLDQISAISAVTRKYGLPLHMDGARFANALASLGTTPAEMTWKRGVDILSFGGTKNGCWCAEAVVLFDRSRAEEFSFLRKRGAQLFSKSRFIAAQFDAYFADGLWLETAAHANRMAARLADGIRASRTARLAWNPQANEVFAIVSKATMHKAFDAGASFYDWHPPQGFAGEIGADEAMCRLVTSFATTEEDVDGLAELIA
ncbi:low specificity L-threonine aldolase [Pseudaminobacter sp. 19-2017]|uniref:L-threonine aldolase n=1 Tax=Pseudaminobacter soli (ex Zhang et al. 2022) TaxID=2831468 RepID=A0A942DZR1_9HYPH|nr:low specificity L-threonine aldolase [Pseudaminobacter soli]MBS3650413.1 low specificity L-threonine aldolase [Pseudaminobacter soli]